MFLDMDDTGPDDSLDPEERKEVKVSVHPSVSVKLHSIKALNHGVTISGLVNTFLVHLLDLPRELGDPELRPIMEDALRDLYEDEVDARRRDFEMSDEGAQNVRDANRLDEDWDCPVCTYDTTWWPSVNRHLGQHDLQATREDDGTITIHPIRDEEEEEAA